MADAAGLVTGGLTLATLVVLRRRIARSPLAGSADSPADEAGSLTTLAAASGRGPVPEILLLCSRADTATVLRTDPAVGPHLGATAGPEVWRLPAPLVGLARRRAPEVVTLPCPDDLGNLVLKPWAALRESAHERLRLRLAAEQERDAAKEELTRTREQLAEALAANARLDAAVHALRTRRKPTPPVPAPARIDDPEREGPPETCP